MPLLFSAVRVLSRLLISVPVRRTGRRVWLC
jgi:hypothetical protein